MPILKSCDSMLRISTGAEVQPLPQYSVPETASPRCRKRYANSSLRLFDTLKATPACAAQARFHFVASSAKPNPPTAPLEKAPRSVRPVTLLPAVPMPAPMNGVRHHHVPRSTKAFAMNTSEVTFVSKKLNCWLPNDPLGLKTKALNRLSVALNSVAPRISAVAST